MQAEAAAINYLFLSLLYKVVTILYADFLNEDLISF